MNVPDWFKEPDWRRLGLYGIALVLILIFARYLIIPALIALTIAVALITRVIRPLRKFGVELATFTTIIAGATLGPVLGAVIGGIAILAQLILGEYLGVYVLWVVPSYILAGAVVGVLGMGIVQLGIGITVAMNVLFLLCTFLFNPQGIAFFLSYAVGNIILNGFLFSTFGQAVAGMV